MSVIIVLYFLEPLGPRFITAAHISVLLLILSDIVTGALLPPAGHSATPNLNTELVAEQIYLNDNIL